MKRLLSLTLSLLMILSCMTCLFTGSVSAEATSINWQSPASWVSFNTLSGTPAVNGPLVQMKSALNQAMYAKVALKPNTQYQYTMYTKNLLLEGKYNQFTIVSSLGSDELDFAKLDAGWSDYKVTNATPNHVADGAVVAYNSYFKDLGATSVTGADGETWQKINVSFVTSDAEQYIIVLNSVGLVDSSDTSVYISDACFEEVILSEWKSGRTPVISTTESDGSAVVPYDKGPAYRIYTWPANQSIYATATLEPNTTYNFTAYFKGYFIPPVVYGGGVANGAADSKGDTWVVSTKAGFDDCLTQEGTVTTDGTWLAFNDDDGYENLYKQDAYRDAYTDLNTWRKYSFNFTTTSDTQYYIVLGIEAAAGNEGNLDFYMSDVSVKKYIDMSAATEGAGTATVSNTAPDEGEEVTFTATPYAGAIFLGWYNGDTKVSGALSYTVTASASLSLTAKFEGEVISWKSPASWVSFNTLSGTPAVNGPLVWMKSALSQAMYAKVELEPNTQYQYTMYTKNLLLENKYNQFTIVSSLGSDELDFAKLDAGWRDYKVTGTSHVADGAVVAYNSYFKDLGATSVTGADGETWQKINVSFVTSDAGEYIIILNSVELVDSSDNSVYISDACFGKIINMTATAEGNGTAKVSASTVNAGEEITFTAATTGGSTFLGWYDGENKVSDELVYTLVVTDSLALTAKFEGGATAVDGWVCPRDTNNWIKTTTDIEAKDGGTVYTTGSWPCDRSIYTKLTLKPNATYTFSAYFMGAVAPAIRNNDDPNQPSLYEDGKGNETWVISANSDITKGNAGSSTSVTDWNEFTGNGSYENLNKGDGSLDAWSGAFGEATRYTTWRKYTLTFTTQEDAEYYIILGLEGESGYQTGQANGYPTYMSDASIIEAEYPVPEVTDFTENLGSSLRKESESANGQAIRHKFVLDKSVLSADYDGYKVVEIGFATAATENLVGHADIPVIGATSYKVLTGVAYKASYDGTVSKNIVFNETDTTVTYTAALYNISDYAKSYTVVPYVIFENADGAQVTRYGVGQIASIFDVAKAILDGSNADDIAYVNDSLLIGDYKTQYDAWVAE